MREVDLAHAAAAEGPEQPVGPHAHRARGEELGRRALHERARVLIGIPSYDGKGIMHRAGVETLENGLLGTVAGLRGVGGGGTFEGVALYAEWTTGPEEWAVYERVWRGQDQAR